MIQKINIAQLRVLLKKEWKVKTPHGNFYRDGLHGIEYKHDNNVSLTLYENDKEWMAQGILELKESDIKYYVEAFQDLNCLIN